MKRRQLIQILENAGCVLLRHGANHDIYINPINGLKQPVPRHKEIQDTLAKHIQKNLEISDL